MSRSMRVALTGATGFIGSAILTRLRIDGHEVVGIARRRGAATDRLPASAWVELDVGRAIRPDDWRPALDGVDAVVNCAGVLQDGASDSTHAVHVSGPAALFAACEAAGIRRVIQVSAVGATPDAPTDFLRTKAEGDADLMRRDLDWVVLKPAAVVGHAAYGGSALLRGLAALPVAPKVRDAGVLQFVQVDDVAESVARMLRLGAPARVCLELAEATPETFEQVVGRYRRWLGYPPAVSIPATALLPLAARLGDFAGALGWRPPIRTNALHEMRRGVRGDPSAWMAATGLTPRTLGEALSATPASVQERWFAHLYLLKPLLLAGLSVFWIASALIAAGPAYAAAEELMVKAGGSSLSGAAVWAGILADLAVGAGIAVRRTARTALSAGIAVSVAYLLGGAVLARNSGLIPLGR